MLDDYSLSRTGVEWRNLASERKQNKSLSKFYMYNQTENENEKDLFEKDLLCYSLLVAKSAGFENQNSGG